MTLTAPVPVYDLGTLIRAGALPVVATARIHSTVLEPYRATRSRGIVDPGPATAQLTAAQARVTRALDRTLAAHNLTPADGRTEWMLDRDGQHWTLTGTWTAT